MLDMLAARVHGDHLQTAAIFDEQMHVLSLVTDPNDYAGPGTGYEPDAGAAGRDRRDPAGPRRRGPAPRPGRLRASDAFRWSARPARGSDPREVVIGLSPGVGRAVWRTLSGLTVVEVLRELLAGLEEEGCTGADGAVNGRIDLGMVGLTAARLAGLGHRHRSAGRRGRR